METIFTALLSGIAAGALSAGKEAISDAYNSLKEVIKRKISEPNLNSAIEQLENNPNSQGRKQILIEELNAVKIDDTELNQIAEKLLRLIKLESGGKEIIQNTQISRGDNNVLVQGQNNSITLKP